MLQQWLDETAGLTLAPAPAVATVRQVCRSAPAPAAATVPRQGAFSAPSSPAVCLHKEAVDYLILLGIYLIFLIACVDNQQNGPDFL